MCQGTQRKNHPGQMGTVPSKRRERCPPLAGACAGSCSSAEEQPVQLFSCHPGGRVCASSRGLVSPRGYASTLPCAGAALCHLSSASEGGRKGHRANHLPSQVGKEQLEDWSRRGDGEASPCSSLGFSPGLPFETLAGSFLRWLLRRCIAGGRRREGRALLVLLGNIPDPGRTEFLGFS